MQKTTTWPVSLYQTSRKCFENPILEDIYNNWRRSNPNSIFGDKVAEVHDEMSSLAPGVRAPIISGIDQNGDEFSLDSLKGHFIYIDVWATWCSPCREKLPKMYSLIGEEYKDCSEIQLLFISVDKDLEKWRTYLSKLPAGGIHINSGSSDLYKDYMIQGIPHYIIIDKSGNIYKSNAPNPDSEEIINILKEYSSIAS